MDLAAHRWCNLFRYSCLLFIKVAALSTHQNNVTFLKKFFFQDFINDKERHFTSSV